MFNLAKQLECEFCGEIYDDSEGLDTVSDGWFCDCCDAFNFYEGERIERDQFLVILEDKARVEETKTTKISRLKRNLSPLRYPGGKSKMIDYLYQHLYKNKAETLYSPFTGGGSFELAMLEAGVVKRVVLNDLDFGVYSLWWSMLNMSDELFYRIQHAQPTHKDYFKAQKQIKNGFVGMNSIEAAWATLLVNRLAYSGISKANPLGGKSGSREKLLARWNPKTLINDIKYIAKQHKNIEIHCEDAYEFMVESYWDNNGVLFIDPPYVIKGAALYNIAMTLEEHRKLGVHLDLLYQGCSGANVIVTYDYNKITTEMFESATETIVVGRRYSI